MSEEEALPRVLCVDDEPNVLEGLERQLGWDYDVSTATGGAEGLACIEDEEEPFAVVLSDMQMPKMDGAAFLARVREVSPETTRVLLTGCGALTTAVEAVNRGQIFRFLTKPCPSDVLKGAVDSAVEQHRLVTAERVLLEQTLHGAVETLAETLALANPAAFGRATRVRRYVRELLDALDVQERWPIEVAATLSQVPCLTLPADTARRFYTGQTLSADEQRMVNELPAIAEKIFAPIPRLDAVKLILRYQSARWDGAGPPRDGVSGGDLPLGARVLKVTFDCEALEAGGRTAEGAVGVLRGREGHYDPRLLETFAALRTGESGGTVVCEVGLSELRTGMVIAEDVRTKSGAVIVPRGQEVTFPLLRQLTNFSIGIGVAEPLRVRSPAS